MIRAALYCLLLVCSAAATAEEIVTWTPFLRQNGNVYYWNEPIKISDTLSRIMFRTDYASVSTSPDGTQYDSSDDVLEFNCQQRIWHIIAQESFLGGRSVSMSRTPDPTWVSVEGNTIGEKLASRACH